MRVRVWLRPPWTNTRQRLPPTAPFALITHTRPQAQLEAARARAQALAAAQAALAAELAAVGREAAAPGPQESARTAQAARAEWHTTGGLQPAQLGSPVGSPGPGTGGGISSSPGTARGGGGGGGVVLPVWVPPAAAPGPLEPGPPRVTSPTVTRAASQAPSSRRSGEAQGQGQGPQGSPPQRGSVSPSQRQDQQAGGGGAGSGGEEGGRARPSLLRPLPHPNIPVDLGAEGRAVEELRGLAAALEGALAQVGACLVAGGVGRGVGPAVACWRVESGLAAEVCEV